MEVDGFELNNITNEDLNTTRLKVQKPRKILHFSDGVMEEYSDAEDECDSVLKNTEDCINVKNLPWVPYMRFKANKMGSSVLAGIDYVGGGLASFLGITTSEAESELAKSAAATSRVITVKGNTDEEQCGTWSSVRNDTVISTDVKKSTSANSEPS